MADVSHELGALRFVVDSPLSSKVAMFNNQVNQHQQSQLLNPFSHDGRASSPKPTFSKDQYGKPLAGSLTEMRGQKANMHVMKEMLELCQIIDSEGYQVKDEPTMRVIPFGELFNIYNYISDKCVGILLRARKHKLLEFEGEMLYQRRDDDVPIFLLRPIVDIRHELNAKIDEIKRGTSPAPQSTSVLLDKSAHEQKLKVNAEQKRLSKSRTPSPAVKPKTKSKSPSPVETVPVAAKPEETAVKAPAPVEAQQPTPVVVIDQPPEATPEAAPAPAPVPAPVTEAVPEAATVATPVAVPEAVPETAATDKVEPTSASQAEATPAPPTQSNEAVAVAPAAAAPEDTATPTVETVVPNDLPTIIVEASATFVRTVSVDPEVKASADAAAAAAAAPAAESA